MEPASRQIFSDAVARESKPATVTESAEESAGAPAPAPDAFSFADLPWWFLAALAGAVGALLYAHKLPNDLMGAFGLVLLLGILLGELGDRLPYFNTLLGGGPVACIFGSSLLVYSGVLPTFSVDLCRRFLVDTNFLNFYIGCVITGALLRLDRRILVGASVKFLVVLLGGIALPAGLALLLTSMTGGSFHEAMLFVVWPILSGGVGGGALPLVQIYGRTGGIDAGIVMSRLIPVIVLGNVLSIIVAAQLHLMGLRWPAWTGNGTLPRGLSGRPAAAGGGDVVARLQLDLLALGLVLSVTVYLVAVALQEFLAPSVHAFVWMIGLLMAARLGNLLTGRMTVGAIQWSQLWMRSMLYPVLVAVGVAFTDLSSVLAPLGDPVHLALVVSTVLGAAAGAGITGELVGFHFVESAIAGGLCLSNMGGTGDLATLSAARRMELLPFSTMATRIGGAIVLLLAGLQVAMSTGGP